MSTRNLMRSSAQGQEGHCDLRQHICGDFSPPSCCSFSCGVLSGAIVETVRPLWG